MRPNYDFPDKIYNEDFLLYQINDKESETLRLPISTYDPNLVLLLFPNIFTDGKRHSMIY